MNYKPKETSVDWRYRASYMLARHGVTVEQATEVLLNESTVVFDPDPASRSGNSIRFIGWSESANAILMIVIVRHEGSFYGSNGWHSSPKDVRVYLEI